MTYIIGEGSERDVRSIPLSTRDGSHIANVRRLEDPPEVRRKAAEDLRREHENARLRSSSSTYNCVGLVFAARRTWVGNDSLTTILERDGFSQVSGDQNLRVGDIVIYENSQGEMTHVGQVVDIEVSLIDGSGKVTVLSKWGAYGEYLHDLIDVPGQYGNVRRFWTERREV
jgi:hypothetical protein